MPARGIRRGPHDEAIARQNPVRPDRGHLSYGKIEPHLRLVSRAARLDVARHREDGEPTVVRHPRPRPASDRLDPLPRRTCGRPLQFMAITLDEPAPSLVEVASGHDRRSDRRRMPGSDDVPVHSGVTIRSLGEAPWMHRGSCCRLSPSAAHSQRRWHPIRPAGR